MSCHPWVPGNQDLWAKESLDTDPSNCLAFSRDSLLSLTVVYQLAALELSQGKGRKMKQEVTQHDWLKLSSIGQQDQE